MADWRLPSARRMAACFSPSATLMFDWRAPSDSVITARRLRSAESIRFMASWTSRGGDDLADLHGGHLAAPALGLLVELGAQHLVDLVALGQHVVEQDVADDGAQRGRRDALERAREVGHVHDGLAAGRLMRQ